MATLPLTATPQALTPTTTRAHWSPAGVPWFLWASALSITCAVIGLHFDISWHRSIGRDAFWNPAHMVLYSSGLISFIYCAYLIAATSFGHNENLRRHSVRVWGLHAPFGVFVAAWGGLGVLYDAIFDNWWHNAYGLDVRFTSPPHLLFSLSLWFEMLGGLLLALSYLNRAEMEADGQSEAGIQPEPPTLNAPLLRRIILWMGGLLATAQLFACFSYTWDTKLHLAQAYIAVAIFLPISLAMLSRVTRYRWTCTTLALIYTGVIWSLILILPLFAATPRLGPIFIPVTHFIPPRFPLLVLFPCFALDLLWQHTPRFQKPGPARALNALLGGAVFTALFVAAEWPFADFLVSPASAGRIFGTRYLGFDDLTAPPDASLWQFQTTTHGPAHLALGLLIAAFCAAIGLYAGSWLGDKMRLIRR